MREHKHWWPAALFAVALVIGVGVAPPAHVGVALRPVDLTGRELDLVKQAPADPIDTAPVEAAVVQINTNLDYQNAIGVGTGIVLSPDGEVLTNNHVVEGATGISGTNLGTGRTFPIDVIGYDRTHDIALVQLRGASGLPTAALGDSNTLAVGDPIVGVGNAGGPSGGLTREPGTVRALNQTIVASDDLTGGSERLTGLIQVAANLRPGDSGGPLVSSAGQVVGIDTAASESYHTSGGGFAIPINQALGIADQIRLRTSSPTVHLGDTGMLGIGVADTRNSGGVAVKQVLRSGPAAQAGLVPGDVITAIDGNAVNNANALTEFLDQHHPGDTVSLAWVDPSGVQRTAPVALAVGPPG
ncbi:S1C family serine protease [Mycobacterium sp.]|uniref:S1C family serine protease n=1 Tax=Mycobacterium sp. TaxID=1785 RepID=UPI002B8BD379|nr:trypsin-like peptidase domain-containing protein [Mycobacterium sp.]HME48848.1 trypsin-like peptidase domain-containing protein [Mycobacterium sp.]